MESDVRIYLVVAFLIFILSFFEMLTPLYKRPDLYIKFTDVLFSAYVWIKISILLGIGLIVESRNTDTAFFIVCALLLLLVVQKVISFTRLTHQ